MAKLPNVTEERQIAQAGVNTGVNPTNYEVSPVNEAFNKLGVQVQKSGSQIVETDNHIQRFNYALNKSRLTREHIALVDKIEKDINDTGDYTVAQENYKLGLNELSENLGSEIGSSVYKQKFDEDIGLLKDQTLSKVQELQKNAQTQQSYNLADQELDNTVEAVMKTRDPLKQQTLINAGIAPLIAAIPNTDPNKNTKIRQVEDLYKKRIGIGVFNSLTPKEQIAALDNHDKDSKAFSTVAFIPAEERPIYRKRAEQALKQQIGDSVEAIKKNDFLRKREAQTRANDLVIHGGNVQDLPIEDYVLLSDEAKNNLNKTSQIYNGSVKLTNEESKGSLYDYLDMYHNNPDELVKTDPIKITSSLNPKDAQMVLGWQKRAANGESIPVDLATQNKVVNQTLNTIGIGPTNKKAAPFKDRFNEEIEYFKEIHKKNPGLKDLQQISHGLVVEATFDGGYFGKTKTLPLYKISRDEVAKQVIVPEDFKNKVLQLKKDNGITSPITEDQFKKLYLKDKFKIISDAGAAEEVNDTSDLLPPGTTDAKKHGFLPDQSREAEIKAAADLGESRGRPTNIGAAQHAKVKKNKDNAA